MTHYIALIILIALLQYCYFTFRVGLLRGKYGVLAPKCTGNDTWERMFRVQQNTMEQLVVFVPGMILFAQYVSATWALLPGVLFIIGRALYSHLYIKDPTSRPVGVALSLFSSLALALGGLIGVGLSLTA
jgi:uncharacterized MAPEG superfamily protein